VISGVGTELVLDSSAAVRAAGSTGARRRLRRYRLIAPPLLWSEVTSAVREASWRGEITPEEAGTLLRTFDEMDVVRSRPASLYHDAVTIAAELGWAKTYDAEFLALARARRCRVATADGRLLRGALRTGLVVSVAELPSS
jgi:predicted nucleic acid-binding protein